MRMGRVPQVQQQTDTGKMNRLLIICIASVFLPTVYSAADNIDWCYHSSTCNDATWPTIATQYCNGSRQSPIDIISTSAQSDANLTAFTFTKFDDRSALTKIKNTGKTVKVELSSGVQVSGGGLSEPYDSLQFHLHWGNGSSIPGSEHTVDGKRYPMELHIVNIKSSLNGSAALGIQDSTGAAALGFFIEVASGNETGSPASWKTLTSFLANITKKDDYISINGLSLDDLLVGVDRAKYYRYLGSLTTPACNEAVVWTVFKDSIKVSKDLGCGDGTLLQYVAVPTPMSLWMIQSSINFKTEPLAPIDLFSATIHISNTTSSLLMTNTYRNIQTLNSRQVTTQASSSTPSLGGASKTLFSLGLMSVGWLLLGH